MSSPIGATPMVIGVRPGPLLITFLYSFGILRASFWRLRAFVLSSVGRLANKGSTEDALIDF